MKSRPWPCNWAGTERCTGPRGENGSESSMTRATFCGPGRGPGNEAFLALGLTPAAPSSCEPGWTPSAQLPSGAKGQSAPQDGLLFTLDQSGAELSQRRYSTGVYEPTSPVAVVYLETGPINFVVTSAGQLLSAPLTGTGTGLFDPPGDAVWHWDARDLKPSAWAQRGTDEGPQRRPIRGALRLLRQQPAGIVCVRRRRQADQDFTFA